MHRTVSSDTGSIPLIDSVYPTGKNDIWSDTAEITHRSSSRNQYSALRACVLCAACVLAINLAFTIAVVVTHGTGSEGRIALFDGDCQQAPRLDAGIHILINFLGTVLLASCNYCMQCLAAPTRKDIDRVHVQGGWLDIGVQSLRNLKHIGTANLVVWVLLAITSLPLHLFYNSVIFSSSATNNYDIFAVNNGFVLPTANVSADDQDTVNFFNAYSGLKRLRPLALNGSLQRLEPADCIRAYAQNLITSRSGLLLVVSNGSSTTQATVFHASYDQNEIATCNTRNEQFPWICNQDGFYFINPDGAYGSQCMSPGYTTCQSRLQGIINNATGWRPFDDLRVGYCLSEQVTPHCKLQTSFEILVIVLVTNLLKLCGIGWAYWRIRAQRSKLRSIGDAIASFLDRRDLSSRGMSLLSANDVHKGKAQGYEAIARPFVGKRQRFSTAVDKTRWLACIFIYSLGIGVMIVLLIHGLWYLSTQPYVQGGPFSSGLDSLDPRFQIFWDLPTAGTEGLISNVLVSNVPQLIISILYFTYNDLVTRMAAAWEWSTYALGRKGLRVTSSRSGEQRSSYFLTLPYRFVVPLMVCCGLLHWLVSQSIYPVVTDHYTFTNNRDPSGPSYLTPQYTTDYNEVTCAWSPVGIVATIIVGTLLVIGLLIIGNFKLASAMPVAGSNSLAIAAACHAEWKSDYRLSQQRVQWGVVDTADGNLPRCGFSSNVGGMPSPGVEYM